MVRSLKIVETLERVGRRLQEKYGKQPISQAELVEQVEKESGGAPGSVLPSDHCYNRTYDGIPENNTPLFFIHEGDGLYRFVRTTFPYTGLRMHYPKSGEPRQVGEWVQGKLRVGGDHLLHEEADANTELIEGAVCSVSINAYERNPEARQRCIEHPSTTCCICRFTYGEVAEGYIHVQHLRPLSEIRAEYIVDPVEDLRPVCPNCHAVLHRRTPAHSIEEVRSFLRQRSRTEPVAPAVRPRY